MQISRCLNSDSCISKCLQSCFKVLKKCLLVCGGLTVVSRCHVFDPAGAPSDRAVKPPWLWNSHSTLVVFIFTVLAVLVMLLCDCCANFRSMMWIFNRGGGWLQLISCFSWLMVIMLLIVWHLELRRVTKGLVLLMKPEGVIYDKFITDLTTSTQAALWSTLACDVSWLSN